MISPIWRLAPAGAVLTALLAAVAPPAALAAASIPGNVRVDECVANEGQQAQTWHADDTLRKRRQRAGEQH
jgi:hypothetical protein